MSETVEQSHPVDNVASCQSEALPVTNQGPSSDDGQRLRVVTMRVDSAQLLVDNENEYVQIGSPGIVLNVSFFQGLTPDSLHKAIRRLIQLPLLSRGMWGDGQDPQSMVDMCRQQCIQNDADSNQHITATAALNVMVVPQANLCGKATSRSASSIRYSDQADKEHARELYQEFCHYLPRAMFDALSVPKRKTKQQELAELQAKQAKNAQHPRMMFQTEEQFVGQYSQFDKDTGLPTHDANGEALSKSAKKKVDKLYKSRLTKYEKAQARQQQGSSATSVISPPVPTAEQEQSSVNDINTNNSNNDQEEDGRILPSGTVLPNIVCGVFGNRQGFRCVSAGPTLHCLDL